jgi:Uma2 family endonuclease
MEPATLLSVEEYLGTSFQDGDREYIDGRVVERAMGEIDHADWQTGLVAFLRARYPHFWSAVEVRVQVTPTRFRVPDVCLCTGARPAGRILTSPPFLVVEVLSPDDRASDVQEKIDDYLTLGIRYVWIVNPKGPRGYVHTPDGSREAKDGVLRTADPEVLAPLAEVRPQSV